MKRGFYTIMAAQFFSSLADNALLIASIALLVQLEGPAWLTPLLKFFFTVSYVVLAAFVGAFADAMPKGKVMFATNTVKMAGCALLFFHDLVSIPNLAPYWFVLAAYAVVGLGAAAYSPAKYGILTELLPAEQLVAANGWIEGLTVVSIVLGTVLGGILIGPAVSAKLLAFDLPYVDTGVDSPAESAILVIAAVYLVAALFNLAIPDTGARYTHQEHNPIRLVVDFSHCFTTLWRDKLGQISLAVTTLFWGAGATLQFIVLKWAEQHLNLPLAQGAMLQGVSAVGIAVGAVLAARMIPLKRAVACCPWASRWAWCDDAGLGQMDAAGLRPAAGGRARGLLRGAHERAAAAPGPRAAVRGALDRGAELQREREHPRDAGALRADDPAGRADQRHHRAVRHVRGNRDVRRMHWNQSTTAPIRTSTALSARPSTKKRTQEASQSRGTSRLEARSQVVPPGVAVRREDPAHLQG